MKPARDEALMAAAKKTGLWETTLDVKKAVEDADFVYTDTWIDMEFFTDPKFAQEKERRLKLMMPYQVNKDLLQGSNAFIMHDMPIHRGYEISGDLIENRKSVIYEQSENGFIRQKPLFWIFWKNRPSPYYLRIIWTNFSGLNNSRSL